MVPLSSLPTFYLLGLLAWTIAGLLAFVLCLRFRQTARGAPRRMRIVNAALAVGMLLFCLTLVEVGFALFCDRTDSFSHSNLSRRWFTLHVQPNAEGFRDREPLHRRVRPGQRRMVFAGDSFTFGHGVEVEDRFSDRIAEELKAATPQALVSNVALPGLDVRGLVDEIAPLALAELRPNDLLIYAIVLNDIEYFDERTGEFYQRLSTRQPQFFLFRDTYFFNWLYYRVRRWTSAAGDYYGYLADAYSGPPWSRMEAKLDELHGLCQARGVELRIVLFPFLQNLKADSPFAGAHHRIAEYCDRRAIPFLDLRAALEADALQGGRLTLNADDAHPNARCHALAADAIRRELLSEFKTGP